MHVIYLCLDTNSQLNFTFNTRLESGCRVWMRGNACKYVNECKTRCDRNAIRKIRCTRIHAGPTANVPLKNIQCTHTHSLSPWFVPLPTSSAAYGVSAGVRQCQLPPSASQWGPASRHLSGQLSLLSTLHCTTLCQASTQDLEQHTPLH